MILGKLSATSVKPYSPSSGVETGVTQRSLNITARANLQAPIAMPVFVQPLDNNTSYAVFTTS